MITKKEAIKVLVLAALGHYPYWEYFNATNTEKGKFPTLKDILIAFGVSTEDLEDIEKDIELY